ncbi:mechanosensitive ion channel family protein [Desulforhopalus sp. IMCC35007]|uniref:mechanosensitive ion channel family protein n=1 Tax=Desulforhopalus sp. IMCC35007 TaxID=2569543 RepID=UPI0010AE0930|nr:mechanosensitive ion channel family protein [Desulforhopalus sp. IMCC35007]TKB10403.1 mechanosensitive ion channel family protein [Desulforhopalus sp. IMCC35007]
MSLQFLESLLSRLREFFDLQHLGLMLGELIIKTIIAVIVLVIFYVIWRLLNGLVASRLKRHFDKTSIAFAETVIKFSIFGVAVVVALSSAGIKTTALLGSLGVAGLSIGFALRDTLSNIISGILVFMDRPFTIDDLVEIDGKYGRVDRITLRTTRIVTNDGKMLAVPNAEIMNKTVTSYTNFPHLRLDVAVTVGVAENLDEVRRVLLSLVQQDTDYMPEPPPSVVVTRLGDYNIELELRVWLEEERDHVKKRFELREKIYKALIAAGVDMPFETIQLAPHKVILNDDGHAQSNTLK